MIYSIKQTPYYPIANLTIEPFPLYAGYGHSWSKFVGCMEYLRPVVSINLTVSWLPDCSSCFVYRVHAYVY